MIDRSFIDEFRRAQKEHVLDLSRDIVIGFGSTIEEDCPNCTYDSVGGVSGASFTNFTGSITVFSGTAYEQTFEARSFRQRCPVCKGQGYFSVPNEKTIKSHVHWYTAAIDSYVNTTAGLSGQNTVRLKTDSAHYEDFLSAKYFIIDGVRVEPVATPVIRSMGTDDGIVEILCRTVDTGKETSR